MLERFYILLAWALPRKLVYFCAWRVWASAQTAKVHAYDIKMGDALEEWGNCEKVKS